MGTVGCCKSNLFQPSWYYNVDAKEEGNKTIPLSVQEWLSKTSKTELIERGVYNYKVMNNFKTIRNYIRFGVALKDKICIITQCSLDRISCLKLMALSWHPGIIECCIYIKKDEMMKYKHTIQSVLNKSNNININIVFQSDVNEYYPINYLRNVSLTNIKAKCDVIKYIFLLDIDFIPSNNLHDILLSDINKKNTFCPMHMHHQNIAFVIPAFEYKHVDASKYHFNLMPKNKSDLYQQITCNNINGFHSDRFYVGHNATNYDKWFDIDSNYEIKYELQYEPYIVIQNNMNVALYDERFAGYGFDKQTHIALIALRDRYRFTVFHNGFVISLYHKMTTECVEFRYQKKRRKFMEALFSTVLLEIFDETLSVKSDWSNA